MQNPRKQESQSSTPLEAKYSGSNNLDTKSSILYQSLCEIPSLQNRQSEHECPKNRVDPDQVRHESRHHHSSESWCVVVATTAHPTGVAAARGDTGMAADGSVPAIDKQVHEGWLRWCQQSPPAATARSAWRGWNGKDEGAVAREGGEIR
ncbi:uncharacterized protein DS421_5g164340 [Arachis hypogaea]|nr:uncharacterized protein DS421_5g164340 [Arachis hypogaea]